MENRTNEFGKKERLKKKEKGKQGNKENEKVFKIRKTS